MTYADIKKLKAFFSALKDSGFKAASINQIPSSTKVAGQWTPVDKSYCLTLLHGLSQFQTDQFKDDGAIIRYFTNPINRKLLLDEFSQAERDELEKSFEVEPAEVEVATLEPAGQEIKPQAGGESASTMAGGIPSAPSTGVSTPRIIHNVPQDPAEPEVLPSKSELVAAGKGGEIMEAGDPSRLVITDKSGRIIKGEGAETLPSKIAISDKSENVVGEHTIPSTAVRRFNFSALRPPASFVNAFKNFGSKLSIFVKRNMVGVTSGLFAGVGGFLGGKIAGSPGVLFGAVGAGSLPPLVKSGAINLNPGSVFGRGAGGVGNFISGLTNRIPKPGGAGGIGSLKKGFGTGKKVAIAFSVLGLLFVFSLISAVIPPAEPTEASPQQGGAVTPVPTDIKTSCPVPQGSISTPSYNANPQTGHCGGGYGYACNCGTGGRRAKAVDVPTGGKEVIMPTINDQEVSWQLIVGPYSVDSQEGGGVGYTFQANLSSDKWYLDMLHLNTGLSLGQIYPSGTSIGTAASGHVHMTMGKNLSQTPVAGTNTDCDPNWLPSDFMCK